MGVGLNKVNALCSFQCSAQVFLPLATSSISANSSQPTYPMFLLPDAMAQGAAKIGSGFVDSLVPGSSRFCTNPGLVIALEGDALNRFRDAAATALQDKTGTTMLTPGIHRACNDGVEKLGQADGVSLLARGQNGASACAGEAALFETDAANFLANPALEDEIFGASSLIVRCCDIAQLSQIAEHLDGQLSATMFLTENDRALALALLPALEQGRAHPDQRLPDRCRSVACDGAWRPVLGHFRQPRHLGGRQCDRPFPAPGQLPGLARLPAAGSPARQQPAKLVARARRRAVAGIS